MSLGERDVVGRAVAGAGEEEREEELEMERG